MMQPMNYTINVGNPADSFMQGAERYAQFANVQAQVQANQQAAEAARMANERKVEQQRQFTELAQDPNPAAIQRFMISNPEIAQQFKVSYDQLNEKEKQEATRVQYMVATAIQQGKPEVAVEQLDKMIEAAKNSGDARNVERLETERDLVLASPEGAQLAANGFLFSNWGPDKYGQYVETMGKERRADEKQPLDIRKMKAETIVKELEAQFAPQNFTAQLGLTAAQTQQARASAASSFASAENSRAQASRANAESNQIRSGIIPVEKRPDAETKMRDEYNNRTKVYQDVKSSFARVQASQDSAAGDLSLIFGYMKMLDPGSVVREGEFANAQNAAGVPDRIRNLYNNAMSGERLNEGQRKMFKGQAKALYETASKQESEVRNGITRIAKGYGLNTENIFYTPEETRPDAETPSALPAGTQLPGGFRVLGVER